VFCVGAGISTNSGIPDFRTPGTGLYSNLQTLKLPYPEAVFSLQYFRQDPEPFYTLAQALYPGEFKPTLTHTFIRLVQEKKMLLRCFTQNIDTLERIAGVQPQYIIEAHGSFASSRCIECKREVQMNPSPFTKSQYPNDEIKKDIDNKKVPRCPKCDGLVKPDIVFFGEALPRLFFDRRVDMQATGITIFLTAAKLRPSFRDRDVSSCISVCFLANLCLTDDPSCSPK
jgi:NAD+-dependent protein deacetylase SIR2